MHDGHSLQGGEPRSSASGHSVRRLPHGGSTGNQLWEGLHHSELHSGKMRTKKTAISGWEGRWAMTGPTPSPAPLFSKPFSRPRHAYVLGSSCNVLLRSQMCSCYPSVLPQGRRRALGLALRILLCPEPYFGILLSCLLSLHLSHIMSEDHQSVRHRTTSLYVH